MEGKPRRSADSSRGGGNKVGTTEGAREALESLRCLLLLSRQRTVASLGCTLLPHGGDHYGVSSALTGNRPILRKLHDVDKVVDDVEPPMFVLVQIVEVQRCNVHPGSCHRYDFLVRLWNGLSFFELFKLLFFTWD